MKQAILVWSFRQNIILGSFLQKSSFSTHGGAAVGHTEHGPHLLLLILNLLAVVLLAPDLLAPDLLAPVLLAPVLLVQVWPHLEVS